MQIIYIKENQKEQWNQFVTQNLYGSFLQSWEWGESQGSLAKKIWRIAIENDDEFIASGLFVKYKLPFGFNYLYSPHGPIISETSGVDSRDIFRLLADEVKKIAKKEKSIFWRMDSVMPDTAEEREEFKKLGLVKSPKEIQTKETLILDITNSEDEILGQMKQKTRYNIGLAQRKGVEVFFEEGLTENFEKFWRLARRTSERDKFRTHPKEYYKKMLQSCGLSRLFLAKYKSKIIAANIVIFFGLRATYLHGASSDGYRNVMAPYLLQWGAIREAKKLGMTEYDFWGIGKKWPGFTRFKKGFGGKEVEYIGAYDIIYKPFWRKLYNLYHKIKTQKM